MYSYHFEATFSLIALLQVPISILLSLLGAIGFPLEETLHLFVGCHFHPHTLRAEYRICILSDHPSNRLFFLAPLNELIKPSDSTTMPPKHLFFATIFLHITLGSPPS